MRSRNPPHVERSGKSIRLIGGDCELTPYQCLMLACSAFEALRGLHFNAIHQPKDFPCEQSITKPGIWRRATETLKRRWK